ncbi:MAG: enoyl-ACP reductase FabI [Propionibacteriaceae bacterium]|jgi:enoyl-[acyl-carrier protein] reductase I|nr:enoyl-ACP reductase FabI [Propionibacteriaceae bacterium]
MGILRGKRVLVTGLTMASSIAYQVASVAQAEGAEVVVSNFGRALGLTRRVVQRLDPVPQVIELDVTEADHLAGLADQLRDSLGGLDGLVHSVAYANPERALGGAFLSTEWEDVATSLRVSAYSLAELVRACQPVLAPGAAVVGLTFDASVSWPAYDWMGVSKAALESVSRYLARYLGPQGVRCNIVSAGPINSIAKQSITGVEGLDQLWSGRAPLGWDPEDAKPTAQAVVALLSDWFPSTTGEIVHVDGGLHSTGA